MTERIPRNEGEGRLAELARARTQARVAKALGCTQGFLSKVLAQQKSLNDEHKAKAVSELGIDLGAWERPYSPPAAAKEPQKEKLPQAPKDEDQGEGPPINDRPGLALDLTIVQLREVRTKMSGVTDPVEWARLARIETVALRTLAELRGEIGNGREMKLRAELEEAKRENALIVSTVKAALKKHPEAARDVAAELKRVFPSEGE